MRITNVITTNKMYSNISKNKTAVDKYYNQMATGKKIQYSSDNPILASRILKFRTTLSEAEQYKRNVAQGSSWLEISELAVSTTQEIMNRIRDLVEQGANDTYDTSDRQNVINDIKNLFAEVGVQMNQTYGGRYVFSGYRTDTEPVFHTQNNLKYEIEQEMNYLDIENFTAYSKTGLDDVAKVINTTRLKLPYKDATGMSIDYGTTQITPVTMSSGDPGAYEPAADEAFYIKDTGEIILGVDLAKDLTDQGRDGFKVNYTKENFTTGEINPKVYFKCTDLDTGKEYDMDDQTMEYEFGLNIRISVNNLSKDMLTPEMYADFVEFTTFVDNVKVSERRDLELKYANPPHNLSGTELDAAVENQIREENVNARAALQKRFEALLGSVDDYMSTISKQRTDLGSRMKRLELIDNRLGDDIVSYSELLSENEDADLMESMMYLNIYESVYQASMNVGAKILQTSLLDFLK